MELSSYIKTKEWRKKRHETFLKKGKKCMKCGSEKQIHVHHATYERIGDENIEKDLFPLCRRCHEFFHKNYVGHIIENTLFYISVKCLPKYTETEKVRMKMYEEKKQKTKKRKIWKEKKAKKQRKQAKQKTPFVSKEYSKTQGKIYKFNEFKL